MFSGYFSFKFLCCTNVLYISSADLFASILSEKFGFLNNPSGYFFNSLIIDRFRNAIEHDRSNWDLIVNNIRTARTGRIVSELRERNIMASDVYQENIIRIGRLNPDLRIVVPDRNDLDF